MRAATFAAAGAAVIGSVNAASHVKHMHAKHHANVARDTWLDWESTSTTTTTSKPVAPATTSSSGEPWLDWVSTTTSSKPVDPATTSSGEPAWDDWVEPTTTITLQSIITTTKYVKPVGSTDAPSWSDWESVSATPVASTTSVPVASVITSTIVPGWSSAGWVGPSWAVEAGQCAISVVTSYGLPTWHPVADVSTTTTTTKPAAVSSTETFVWADWSSTTTSSIPAVVTTTTSSTLEKTWEEWQSTTTTTTSIPVVPVTTSTHPAGGWPQSSAVPVTTATHPAGGWAQSSAVPVTTSTYPAGGWSQSSVVPVPNGGSYPGITPNGNSWGLTYSPYTAQSGCKDAATVAKDLALIAAKGFTTVRVYSTDCSTLENIGKSARDNGLKLILGVWINASGFSAAQAQVDDIVKWAQWDIVELIVVGNEVIFNNIASPADLAGFVSSSKWAFKAAGFTGPVTTTEPLTVWGDSKNSGPLSAVIDVVGANLYAFFNAQISADKAGGFIQAQINELNGIFAGKSIYVLESGWPHSGQANGAAVPSPENQAIALKGIQAAVGAQVVFLSYEDEPWKEPGQFGVEPFWGCVNVF